jgi:hypothetical protein
MSSTKRGAPEPVKFGVAMSAGGSEGGAARLESIMATF